MPELRDPLDFPDYLSARRYVACAHCTHPVDATREVSRAVAVVAGRAAWLLDEGTPPHVVVDALERLALDAVETENMYLETDPLLRPLFRVPRGPAPALERGTRHPNRHAEGALIALDSVEAAARKHLRGESAGVGAFLRDLARLKSAMERAPTGARAGAARRRTARREGGECDAR